MTSNQITQFLTCLKAKNIKVNGNWVQASCIFAPWKHKYGTDNNPSFGIFINDSGRSGFSCFSCSTGSMEELLQSFELYNKENLKDYNIALCHSLLDEELKIAPLPEYIEGVTANIFEEFPAYWLDSFPSVKQIPEALDYLEFRKVLPEFIDKCDLRFDNKFKMIVFPYYSVYGKLAGARGRSILNDAVIKHKEYKFNGKTNCRTTWYAELNLNLVGKTVVVEGQLDAIKVMQAYPKVVANMTALPTLEKMKKLSDSGNILQIADSDEAGIKSTIVYKEYCRKLGIGYKCLQLKSDNGEKLDPDMCHVDWLKDEIHKLI